MRSSLLRSPASLVALFALAVLGASACDDDGSGGTEGCRADTDCKGDRICVGGTCVEQDMGMSDGMSEVSDATDMADVADSVGMDLDEVDTRVTDLTSAPDQDTSMPSDADVMEDVAPDCMEGESRCSLGGDVEQCEGGRWAVSEQCVAGCRSARCAMPGEAGTCTDPVAFGVGTVLEGTTDTTYNPNIWSQTCRSRYAQQTGVSTSPTGPESVFRLGVSEPQMLRLSLRALDPTYYALYVRTSCTNAGSEVHSVCGGSLEEGGNYVVERFFAPGEYYVFVDDFGVDGEGPGRFELEVEPVLLPACGGQVPQILDVREDLSLVGDTANGIASEDWHGSLCPVVQSTAGNENLYVFGLPERATVRISATPLEPSDSRLAVYLRTRCSERFDQAACGYTAGDGSARIEQTLDAGAYYLFVDDFGASIDGPQTYQLSIQVD